MHNDPEPARRPSGGARRQVTAEPDRPPQLTENLLLRLIPDEERAQIAPLFETIALEPLETLAQVGDAMRYVWFPTTCIISILRGAEDGARVETGTVGREGMAGLMVVLGDNWSPAIVQAQAPGVTWRAPFDAFRDALPALPHFQSLLGRYALTFIDQMGQTIVCNSWHSLEQRCARWLLTAHDRVDGDMLQLTHEVLAQMLAVRRAGVTEAALALKRAGLIDYTRGRVTVLDREGLEGASCPCYQVNRRNFERLIGAPIEA